MPCVRGDKLSVEAHRQVLDRYVHRNTVENRRLNPRYAHWAEHVAGITALPVSDEAWLKEHAFHVRADGRLDERYDHAEPACLADDWAPEGGVLGMGDKGLRA